MKTVFILLIFPLYCKGAAQTCTNNIKWPASLASGFTGYTASNVDSNTGGSGFLMEGAEYHVPDTCTCGVLYKWIFMPVQAGDIEFQVWNHIDNDIYELQGENYFTVTSDMTLQTITFMVPEKDRITIRNNYLLGWYTAASTGIIGFKDSVEAYSDEARREPGMTNLSPSIPAPRFDWSSGTSVVTKNKIYAIGAETLANKAPAFTNLPRTVWIYEDETAGAFIYQISADDMDSSDVPYLDVQNTDTLLPSAYFNYSISTQQVFLARDYPPANTYTLTFQVQDQCLNTGTGTLTIVVRNWAPSLSNMPAFATIDESTIGETVLYNIEWSDKDDTTLDAGTPSITPSVTPSVGFSLRSEGYDQCYSKCATNVSIVIDGSALPPYSTDQQYQMDVTFTDGNSPTNTGVFMLYVTKNDPPKFTNLDNGAKAYTSYLTTANGDVIYTVSATDAENDKLVFTMTCDPAGCPLIMTNDNSNGAVGVISATADFRGRTDTGWDIAIYVTDTQAKSPLLGTTVGPKYVSVVVQDINFIPRFVNLPVDNPISVHEGTALGTTLFTVTYLDINEADNHTFIVSYSDTWVFNYFELDNTTGVLKTAHNVLDYEEVTPKSATATITITDGVDTASQSLTIVIRNVNEAPYFHQTKYTLEVPEEGASKASAGDWQPIIKDPDVGDTHKYRWDCGIYTRYFRMSVSTGAVTFATAFDYDTVNFTAPYDCVVTVTDKAGLTATTTIEIDIHDENDNPPVFSQTTDYYIFQTPSLEPGRFVGQVTATDADRNDENKAIHYSWHTYPVNAYKGPFLKNYLLINDYGNIYVNETWSEPLFDFDTSYTFIVRAENVKDSISGTRLSATATVILYLSGTTTTQAVTTDRPLEFIQDTRNVTWMAVVLTMLGVLLIIVCGFAMMYTIQVKRYRWCIPWCRKRLLGLKKMTQREKRRYYRGLLMQEELEELGSDSDEGQPISTLHFGRGGTEIDANAPPMRWNELKNKGKGAPPRGPTVRKATNTRASVAEKKGNVPQAAVYEPKPPKKQDVSKMMKTAHSKFWN